MITLWRLTARSSITEAFDGEGARKYGGRWNPKGMPCVYASNSPALALLENLVHFDLDTAPSLYLYSVDLDDDAVSEVPRLPAGWQDDEQATQSVGGQWLQKNQSLALEVPSAIIPIETNYVVNPLHSDFKSLKITEHGQFDADRRLFR